MKRLAIALIAVLAAVSTAPAVPPLTMTVLGTLQTGGLRDEDPRIAEINAFDPSGQRIYVVNPSATRRTSRCKNNAMAIINIAGASVEQIVGLGLKDHSLDGNKLNVRDNDSRSRSSTSRSMVYINRTRSVRSPSRARPSSSWRTKATPGSTRAMSRDCVSRALLTDWIRRFRL